MNEVIDAKHRNTSPDVTWQKLKTCKFLFICFITGLTLSSVNQIQLLQQTVRLTYTAFVYFIVASCGLTELTSYRENLTQAAMLQTLALFNAYYFTLQILSGLLTAGHLYSCLLQDWERRGVLVSSQRDMMTLAHCYIVYYYTVFKKKTCDHAFDDKLK